MKSSLRSAGATAGLSIALCLSPVTAFSDPAGVTDLSAANVSAIESNDIVEALAVPRGTKIRPNARPTVRLPVYFEFNSAQLKPEAMELLERVGGALDSDDLETFRFSIEGHTDSIGPESYNDGLSAARANAVVEFLASRGVADDRLRSIGRGETQPVASNEEDTGRQRNRRVEIINMGSAP